MCRAENDSLPSAYGLDVNNNELVWVAVITPHTQKAKSTLPILDTFAVIVILQVSSDVELLPGFPR
jgi:hypothetical protein